MPRGTHVHVCCAHAPRAAEEELQQREEQQQQAWGEQQAALVVALRHALPDREVTCSGASGEVEVEQVGLVVVCASQRLIEAVNGREVEDAVAQIVQHLKLEEEDDQQGSEDDVVFALDGFDPLQVAREKSALYVEGTRAWALDEFRAWTNRPASVWASDNVLVFVGPAGFGKSVLMARICDENGLLDSDDDDDDGADEASSPARKKRRSIPLLSMLGEKKTQEQTVVKVRAAHFFKHDDKQACNLKTCLLSVANQLAAVLPAYREEIAKLDKNEILHGLGPAVLFERLIAEPMSKVPEPSERVVVLLDALDEVTEADRGVLLHIVRHLWYTTTPEWVGLVLSTRPEDPIRDTLEVFRPTVLQLDDERNLADLRRFLETRLRRQLAHVDRDLQRAVEILAERAEGLFLYAYFVDQTLVGRERQLASLEELEEVFPDGGIDDMYQSYFSRLLEGPLHGDQELYGVLLGTLVAARSPVPRNVLQGAVRLGDTQKLDEILARSAQLLTVGVDTVRFIHKSMSDFLQNRRRAGARLVVDAIVGHRHLARVVIDAPTFMRSSPFLLRHALFHLGQADELDAVADWLFEFRNLHGAVSCKGVDPADLVQDAEDPVWKGMNEEHPRRREAMEVVRTLEMSGLALRHDPDELAGQIIGRIRNVSHPLRKSTDQHWRPDKPWLQPVSSACLESCRSCLRKVLQGSSFPMAISDDGKTLVAGTQVLDTVTGAVTHKIPDEIHRRVSHLAASGDCKTVAIASVDKMFGVWNADFDSKIHKLFEVAQHEDQGLRPTWCVVISRDGFVVIGGFRHLSGGSGVLRVWNGRTGEETSHVQVRGVPQFLAMSDDAKVVVMSVGGNSLSVLDGKTLTEKGVMRHEDGHMVDLALSSDGKVVVGAFQDTSRETSSLASSSVEIWDVCSGLALAALHHSDKLTSVAISGDGKTVLSGWFDGSVRLWSARAGVERTLGKCLSSVDEVAITRDGRTGVIGSDSARILDLCAAQEEPFGDVSSASDIDPKGRAWVLSPNGETLFTLGYDGFVHVWSTKQFAHKLEFRPDIENLSHPGLPSWFSRVSSRVVAINDSQMFGADTIQIWNTNTGMLLKQWPISSMFLRNTKGKYCVDAHEDGLPVVLGCPDHSVRVYAGTCDNKELVIRGHTGPVHSVSISQDGETMRVDPRIRQ
ncbi:Vegetative incompatibility protein HET-E-1 [Durusdinium trenchii]|uniref:Vegetative incompatibility protein HET-E-1 n=1 Tax=Durusdinium trenchii TaxID=1381693 RepID=A0ABP0QUG6_9DINO